jgi:hypothetical protein
MRGDVPWMEDGEKNIPSRPAKNTRIKRRKHELVKTLQASQIRKKRILFID